MVFFITKGLSTLRERERESETEIERAKMRERDKTWEDN